MHPRLWPEPRVDETAVGHRRIITFVGELDVATTPMLDRALERAAGMTEIWIDLRRASFMDASGVHWLIRARNALAAAHRRFAVICGAGPVRRVLTLTAADQWLELYDDRAAANRAG